MVDHTRRGRCYELAGRHVSEAGGILVHGTMRSLRFPTRIGHAWVETPDGRVWEPITEVTHDPAEFVRLFTAVPIRRYDQTALWAETDRSGHWGPWEADTDIPDPPPWPTPSPAEIAAVTRLVTERDTQPPTP